MELNVIAKNLSYNIDIRSISDNPDNKLGFYTYANLYNYFVNEKGQSYHTLVNSKVHGIREEFCLLMNDVDIILITIEGYGLDYKIEQEILTIYLYIKDSQPNPAKIPFKYDLNDLMTLYELDLLLKQDSIYIFFVELINNILMLEHEMKIELPEHIGDKIRENVDKYIQENMSKIIGVYPEITISKMFIDNI